MAEHECIRTDIIGSLRTQVGDLFSNKNDQDRRITELETTLMGAERNPGGFIGEMRLEMRNRAEEASETRKIVSSLSHKLDKALERPKLTLKRFMAEAAKILGSAAAIATAVVVVMEVFK